MVVSTEGNLTNTARTKGIRIEYTVPKTSELNGLAERMNPMIMEKVRSMLSHAKLPESYSVEAMYTIVYPINRSPSVPLKGDVPQRVSTGKDISYQHLRVSGCMAYMHVAKDKRSKLNNKSKSCIFMGYSEDEFGYRLWDLINKKVVRSGEESNDFQQWIDMYEPKPNEESSETSKPKPTAGGRRYPLRERRAPI